MAGSSVPAAFQPVGASRLHEGVVRQIVAGIVGGDIRPGDPLPTEHTLAAQFGVSRTVIREAVRVLVGKGLVAVKHGSGMQAQPSDRWNSLDPLILFEQIRRGRDETVLREVLELRRVVEVEIAALASRRRTSDDLRALRAAVEGMRAVLDDPTAYTRLDIAFHEAILAAGRNRLLVQALRPAGQALAVGRLISSRRPGGPAESERGHESILVAIEAADEEGARVAMRHHIVQFEDDVRVSLGAGLAGDVADLAQRAHALE
jgi:GntR family transcriptional repressor for pyruvate dehydrogenase complex